MTQPLKKHLVLIGLMGSGKSSVGRCLSGVTGIPFVDTDALVEAHERKRVREIFADSGEEHFRELEHEMVAKIMLETTPSIVATGGGAIIREANRKLLWQHGFVVYLQAGVDLLLERTSRNSSRPLLSISDPRLKLEELLASRAPFYEQADLICPVSGKNIQEVGEAILAIWKKSTHFPAEGTGT